MACWMLGLCVLGLVLWAAGRWWGKYFERRGLKYRKWSFPLLGNMAGPILGMEHLMEALGKTYHAFPDQKYVGFMQIVNPVVLVRDVELIKQLSIKEFDSFHDHPQMVDPESDPLFGNGLFALEGQKWRDMRCTLSPAFTSSKMRNMFGFIVECAEQMAEYYVKKAQDPRATNKDGVLEVELKDTFSRCTNDVIATCAFGLEVDSLKDPENSFYLMGKKISTGFSGWATVKIFLSMAIPNFAKTFGAGFLTDHSKDFFRSIVAVTMKSREEQSIHRPDMIQLLMEAKKGSLKHETTAPAEGTDAGFATVEESNIGKQTVKREWSPDDLAAQAFLFFFAGFDSASALLSFMAHELAIHPDIQDKLQQEIDEVAAQGSVGYNEMLGMKYLDMVVSETLRYWPPGIAGNRTCTRDFTLPSPNYGDDSPGITIRKGQAVWFPIQAIHRDPNFFPNPEKFDPERFSDENKDKIKPNTYIPFGLGPRNCIGSRFALMETKAIIFHLLRKFSVVVIQKTDIPLQIKRNTFSLQAKNGFWVGLKLRDNLKA